MKVLLVRGRLVLGCFGFVNLHQYALPTLIKLKPFVKTISGFVLKEVFASEIPLTFYLN